MMRYILDSNHFRHFNYILSAQTLSIVFQTLEERLCAEFPPMLPKAVFHKMKSKSSIHEDRKKI